MVRKKAIPEIIEDEKAKFWKNMNAYLEKQITDRGVTATPNAINPESYDDLPEEGKKAVDALMEELKPDIKAKAEDLLFAEIRDKIARSGDLKKLQEYAAKGQNPSIKRKKGCIFIQYGSGAPNDEIHEFNVATT
jgi:hypothetical protein